MNQKIVIIRFSDRLNGNCNAIASYIQEYLKSKTIKLYDMDAYATGVALKNEGVVSGYDSTFEAALTKLFFLMGQNTENDIVRARLGENVKGEISR